MAAKHSAGILLYRNTPHGYEVLIVHPGGPLWAKRDAGTWSMPKGECDEQEALLDAAKREFAEEVGAPPPGGDYRHLGDARQSSGKIVHAFTLKSDFNLERFKSNIFHMEWPPKSGKQQEFPENDKAAWVSLATARVKLVKGQVPLLEALAGQLRVTIGEPEVPPAEPQQESGQTSLL